MKCPSCGKSMKRKEDETSRWYECETRRPLGGRTEKCDKFGLPADVKPKKGGRGRRRG